jgi:phage-related protein
MAQPPVLTLTPNWDVRESHKIDNYETPLNDGYKQVAIGGMNPSLETWEVSRSGLSEAEANSLHSELSFYSGVVGFQWRAVPSLPYRIYFCESWSLTEQGDNCWQISATFQEDISGQCVSLVNNIDSTEILGWLAATNTWLTSVTRNALPLLINTVSSNPYLLTNAFQDVQGRGGYFPGSSGTSEGQFTMIRACLAAYAVTADSTWLNRATNMAAALEPVLYRGASVPSSPSTLWYPHWLFNVKAAFTSKGKTNSDPLAYGYFDVVVSFTSGVGTIASGGTTDGEKLSDVYSVYATGAKLLWQNVYAPVVFGGQYTINYWVSNSYLAGTNYRIYPTTAASNGTLPTVTTETAGKIVLNNTGFSGNLKVTYSALSGPSIATSVPFEAYPMWRALLSGEIGSAFDALWWGADAYLKLFQATGLTKWQQAYNATIANTATAAVVQNPTYWYKKENNPDPFSYPGTQVVQVNNTNGYTATRETGTLTNAAKIVVAAAPGGNFPSLEVQNFAVQANIDSGVTIPVQFTQSTTAVVQIVLSQSSDAFDLTKLYYVNWLVTGSSTSFSNKTFIPEDFFRWDSYLVWHLRVADSPLAGFSGGGGGRSTYTYNTTIPYNGKNLQQSVGGATINAGASGYAGFALVLIAKQIKKPPKLAFYTTKNVILRIVDGASYSWDCTITSLSTWTIRQFQWSDFTFSTVNSGSSPGSPDNINNIQSINFVAINASGATDIGVWFASDGDRYDPDQFAVPATAYKAAIVSRNPAAHTLWIGDFRPLNSTSDALQYNPGCVPFTVNILSNAIDAWRGVPYSGYQSPYHWWAWGYTGRANQVLDFLASAQNAYAVSTGVVGPFAPVFSWGYWDASDYLANGLNKFGWNGPDPNTSWVGYQMRPLEATARFLYADGTGSNKGNAKARSIVMKFLGFLDSHFFSRKTTQPPTNYEQGVYPTTLYHEPHAAALIMRSAIYANLSGCDPSITYRLINAMYSYLKSQYVSIGTMAGTFTSGQPTFTSGGTVYRENFGFWVAEIVEALALYLSKKDGLIFPPCAAPTSYPLPAIVYIPGQCVGVLYRIRVFGSFATSSGGSLVNYEQILACSADPTNPNKVGLAVPGPIRVTQRSPGEIGLRLFEWGLYGDYSQYGYSLLGTSSTFSPTIDWTIERCDGQPDQCAVA